MKPLNHAFSGYATTIFEVGSSIANGSSSTVATAADVAEVELRGCLSHMPVQVMSKLAAEHKSVNLGQGFPDDEGPESMKQVGFHTAYGQ